MFSLILGATLSFAILLFTFMQSKAGIATFINQEGILVVLGGTLTVLVTTSKFVEIKRLFRLFKHLLFEKKSQKILKEKLLSIVHAIEKGRAPEASGNYFLDRAVGWYSAGLRGEELSNLLIDGARIEIERTYQSANILVNIAKYPPALGMVGTVFGIIGIFSGLGSTEGQKMIGANLAVSMSSTLYGLVLANFVISPISELLTQAAQLEEVELSMIVDTIQMISAKESSFFIQEKIELYNAA